VAIKHFLLALSQILKSFDIVHGFGNMGVLLVLDSIYVPQLFHVVSDVDAQFIYRCVDLCLQGIHIFQKPLFKLAGSLLEGFDDPFSLVNPRQLGILLKDLVVDLALECMELILHLLKVRGPLRLHCCHLVEYIVKPVLLVVRLEDGELDEGKSFLVVI
jgi:hypothetical protein